MSNLSVYYKGDIIYRKSDFNILIAKNNLIGALRTFATTSDEYGLFHRPFRNKIKKFLHQ